MKLYVCNKCGNVIFKLEDKSESLVCCGKTNTIEAALEKHLSVYEGMINIKVGDKPEASFPYDKLYKKIYADCNLHSLWFTESK